MNRSVTVSRIKMGRLSSPSRISGIKYIEKLVGIALQALWEDRRDQKQCGVGRTELSLLQTRSQTSVCVPWAWGVGTSCAGRAHGVRTV